MSIYNSILKLYKRVRGEELVGRSPRGGDHAANGFNGLKGLFLFLLFVGDRSLVLFA